MSYELLEPIFKEDVEATKEDIDALDKGLENWIRRLQKQQAPPELIAKIGEVQDYMKMASSDLSELAILFPESGNDEG